MIMKYDKMVAITQAESQRKMNIAKNTISDMLFRQLYIHPR